MLVLRLTRGDDARAWWGVAGMVALRFLGLLAARLIGALLGLLLTAVFVPLLSERIFLTSWRALDAARADELAAATGLTLRQDPSPFVPALAVPILGPFLFTVAQAAAPVLVRDAFKSTRSA